MKRLLPNEPLLVVLNGHLAVVYRDPRSSMESETGFKLRLGEGFRFEDYADEGVTWIRKDATIEERQAFLVVHALS